MFDINLKSRWKTPILVSFLTANG